MPTKTSNLRALKDSKFHGFPDQRVSEKEKQSEEWYIKCINYIIDRALAEDEKSEVIKHFNASNGEIDESTIQYALSPYGKDVQQQAKQIRFPNTIRDLDIIVPIKERYMGEYIKQYSNHQVYIHDSDSVFERNEQLKAAVKSKIFAKFQELIETGDESVLEDLDIEAFSKEFIEEWVDERVIRGQRRLDLINDLTNSTVNYIQAFLYWFATEEVYSHRRVVNNELKKEIIPPWEYYRIDSGNLFVEDDDMGVRKYKMSINQIIDEFRDEFQGSQGKRDFEYLRSLLDKYSTSGDPISVQTSLIMDRKAWEIYDGNSIYKAKPNTNLDITDASRLLDVYHCVWKTEKEIRILKYADPLTGEIKETEVSPDYELDAMSGDISLTKDYINEVYESWRFGGRFEGVYLPARPVEVQRQEVNNSSICKLPYNGLTGLLKHNAKRPVPSRLIAYQELIKLYNFQREKAIAKFKTFNLIPESILLDSDEMTLEERFHYAAMDDILPFRDIDMEPGVYQAIKSLYNQGAERYITILTEVIESLKRDAMDEANMNEQRFGDIGQQAGKSVTEYAITKATTGSILMFEMFNKFKERDYMADLDYSKAAWVDGKQGSYIDPNTKDVVYVDIDGVSDLGTNWGVFIRNSALEEEKLKQYREIAFAASQGGEYGVAADAVHSENSTEIRKIIKKAQKAKEEYQKNMEESRNQMQERIAQLEQEKTEKEKLHDEKITKIKEHASTNRKIMEIELGIMKLEAEFEKTLEMPDGTITDDHKVAMDEARLELERRKQELDEVRATREKEAQPQ